MNGSTTALLFDGTAARRPGLFAAGNVALTALGIVSLFGAGVFETISVRSG